jgi:hypothetical protein
MTNTHLHRQLTFISFISLKFLVKACNFYKSEVSLLVVEFLSLIMRVEAMIVQIELKFRYRDVSVVV